MQLSADLKFLHYTKNFHMLTEDGTLNGNETEKKFFFFCHIPFLCCIFYVFCTLLRCSTEKQTNGSGKPLLFYCANTKNKPQFGSEQNDRFTVFKLKLIVSDGPSLMVCVCVCVQCFYELSNAKLT